jgi:hypothetical protein
MTPDFPVWAGSFADQVKRLRTTAGNTLHQFELLFSSWIPHWRLAQQDEGAHSRHRRWNLRLTFWTFLWQIAQAGASCREAIRQAQALCRTQGQRLPPDENCPTVRLAPNCRWDDYSKSMTASSPMPTLPSRPKISGMAAASQQWTAAPLPPRTHPPTKRPIPNSRSRKPGVAIPSCGSSRS